MNKHLIKPHYVLDKQVMDVNSLNSFIFDVWINNKKYAQTVSLRLGEGLLIYRQLRAP